VKYIASRIFAINFLITIENLITINVFRINRRVNCD